MSLSLLAYICSRLSSLPYEQLMQKARADTLLVASGFLLDALALAGIIGLILALAKTRKKPYD